MQELVKVLPGTIVSGIVRVDIMCLNSGWWVVNEFESYEAITYNKGDRECDTQSFLNSFWESKIKIALHTHDEYLRLGRKKVILK